MTRLEFFSTILLGPLAKLFGVEKESPADGIYPVIFEDETVTFWGEPKLWGHCQYIIWPDGQAPDKQCVIKAYDVFEGNDGMYNVVIPAVDVKDHSYNLIYFYPDGDERHDYLAKGDVDIDAELVGSLTPTLNTLKCLKPS